MKITAAQYEARRQFALAFRASDRPDLKAVLGANWSLGLELYRLNDQQYYQQAVKVFNKRMGIAHFAPADKRSLFNITGV